MLDPSLDKALDLAFSLASNSFAAALRGVQSLSSLTGVKPEVIVAGTAGLITFIVSLKVVSDLGNRRDLFRQAADLRRPRHEVPKGWPSQGSRPNEIQEAPSDHELELLREQVSFGPSGKAGSAEPVYSATQRTSEPSPTDPAHSQYVDRSPPRESRFQLTDQFREQLQKKFLEKGFEPSGKASSAEPVYSATQRTFEPSPTADITDPAHSQYADRIPPRESRLELADQLSEQGQKEVREASSQPTRRNVAGNLVHSCLEYANRVHPEGLRDFLCRLGGWYPWFCSQCGRCFYRHQRY